MTTRLHPNVTSAAEGLLRRRFSVAEVEAMAAAGILTEDERVELIGGELVPMSRKGIRHELVKAALLDRWYRARPEACRLVPATTFRLSEDTFLEPDVVIYERAAGLGSLSGKTVLLVVEIADTSLQFDIGRKARLYSSFGVRELWVIDAVGFALRAFRAPSSESYREMQDCCACEAAVPRFAPTEFALTLEDLSVENDELAEDLREAAIRDMRGLGWEGDLDDRG